MTGVILPPVLSSVPAQTAIIGQRFQINLSSFASDPNTPALPLTYSLTGNVPTGATVNPTNGVFTWIPTTNQPTGQITVSFEVSDNSSPPNTVLGSFVVEVSAAIVSPTSTPTPTPTQAVILGGLPLFQRKLNRKGNPTGKAVLTGFALEFVVPLDAADANAASYQVDTVTTKKVKGKKVTVLHPIENFAVSYLPASDAVQITLESKQTFPTGGQITILGGLTTASGGELTGPAVFTIAKGGKEHRPVVKMEAMD